MSAKENKKGKAKESRNAELEAKRLKIKKELDEIIERTEEQNRALRKVLKKEIKTEKI